MSINFIIAIVIINALKPWPNPHLLLIHIKTIRHKATPGDRSYEGSYIKCPPSLNKLFEKIFWNVPDAGRN